MAYTCTKFNNRENPNLAQFVADSVDDLRNLPTATQATATMTTVCMGSTCILSDGTTYMLFSDGWKPI